MTIVLNSTRSVLLGDSISNLLKVAWKTLGRYPDLKYSGTAGAVIDSLLVKPPEVHTDVELEIEPPNMCIAENHTSKLHKQMREAKLWGADHDVDYASLPDHMLLNYTLILLAGDVGISRSLMHFKFNRHDVPVRRMFDTNIAEELMSTNEHLCNWRGVFKLEQPVQDFLVEARFALESAWRNRHKDRKGLWHEGALRWENTTVCVLEAIYRNVENLNELSYEPYLGQTKFRTVCEYTHNFMIENGLWGKDNNNPDRAYGGGIPKRFHELSSQMKENYVLIVLSALSSIARQALSEERRAVESMSYRVGDKLVPIG